MGFEPTTPTLAKLPAGGHMVAGRWQLLSMAQWFPYPAREFAHEAREGFLTSVLPRCFPGASHHGCFVSATSEN